MSDNDSQRIVAEEYAATDPKPGLFWLDLADDLRDPAFRRAYEAGWREALKARDTAYDDDRCSCTACLVEFLAACPTRSRRPGVAGEASTYSTENPEPFVVQAILGLPARLKAHRAAHSLSQREVARRCGVSFATISRIESGEDYVVSNLIALAAYLEAAR